MDCPPDSLPLAGAPDEGWLGLELLVLDVPAELLELLLGGGVLLGGGGGVCGCVGVLALGQPHRSRHKPARPAIRGSCRHWALLQVKCFDTFFSL